MLLRVEVVVMPGRCKLAQAPGQRRHGLPSGTIVTFSSVTGVSGLSLCIALHARDGLHHIHARVVALAEERVVLIERRLGLLR